MNGGTNIAAALAQAGAVLKAGAAPAAARLLVLLTDGRVDGYQSKEAKVGGRAGRGQGGSSGRGWL
jgi:Mg-chelatase subunit ChlD